MVALLSRYRLASFVVLHRSHILTSHHVNPLTLQVSGAGNFISKFTLPCCCLLHLSHRFISKGSNAATRQRNSLPSRLNCWLRTAPLSSLPKQHSLFLKIKTKTWTLLLLKFAAHILWKSTGTSGARLMNFPPCSTSSHRQQLAQAL